MTIDRDVLDRLTPLFPAPERPFDGFERRRSRKHRNRRIGAVVLALVITLASVGGLVRAFRATEERTPADRINSTTARDLHLAWTIPVGAQDDTAAPVADAGMVYVVGDGTLYAVDSSCAGPACSPEWTAAIGPHADGTPVVSDGVVYVSGDHLFAFAVSCGSGGATCAPLWVSAGPAAPVSTPVVTEGVVLAVSDHVLSAYPVGCRTDAGPCDPTWTEPGIGHMESTEPTRPAVVHGILYLSSERGGVLRAFDPSCALRGACEPLWTWTAPDGADIDDPVVSGGLVFVNTRPGSGNSVLHAFDGTCADGGRTCEPAWTADVGGQTALTVVDGIAYGSDGCCSITAFDASRAGPSSRAPLWIVQTSEQSGVTVTADGVFVGLKSGKLVSFPLWASIPTGCDRPEAQTCSGSWTADVAHDWLWAPVEVGGVVFAGGIGGPLVALDPSCTDRVCRPLWSSGRIGDGMSPPAFTSDTVFVRDSQQLYAFSAEAST